MQYSIPAKKSLLLSNKNILWVIRHKSIRECLLKLPSKRHLTHFPTGLKNEIRAVCAEEFLVCGEGDEQGSTWMDKVQYFTKHQLMNAPIINWSRILTDNHHLIDCTVNLFEHHPFYARRLIINYYILLIYINI